MANVIAALTMSVDGYIAYEDHTVGHLFDWYEAGDVEVHWPGDDMVSRVSPPSARYLERVIAEAGALVVGRTVYDITGGFGSSHPVGVPLFLVTHEPPAAWPRPDAPFTAVTDGVASAIEQAKVAAGDKSVSLSGASMVQQALALDLVDEIAIELAPVVLGRGIRFFGELDRTVLLDDPEVIEGERVTHLRFRVRRDA
jgi:dihydrofolate reductase